MPGFSGRIDVMKSELFGIFRNGITTPVNMGDAMYIGSVTNPPESE